MKTIKNIEDLTQEELIEELVANNEINIDEDKFTIEEMVDIHRRLTEAALYVRDHRYDEWRANCRITTEVIVDNKDITLSVFRVK